MLVLSLSNNFLEDKPFLEILNNFNYSFVVFTVTDVPLKRSSSEEVQNLLEMLHTQLGVRESTKYLIQIVS